MSSAVPFSGNTYSPVLRVSSNIFWGTFQHECYTAYQNFLSVTISFFVVPFSVNTMQHTKTSSQLQYLLQYLSVWIRCSIPKLPVSYNIFCSTFQREYDAAYQNFLSVTISFAVPFSVNMMQHTKTSCQLQYLLRYLSAWMLPSIPNLPLSSNIFCGTFQREYYATHQYFLSPRSLYLVMWSIIEGERGVEGLQQWLINIQVRSSTGVGFVIWASFFFSPFFSVFPCSSWEFWVALPG